MTIKIKLNNQARKFGKIFNERQSVIKNIPARMGDGQGHLHVPDRPGYIYVTINDHPYEAYCGKISPEYSKRVLVGVPVEEGQRGVSYQVLSEIVTNSNDASLLQIAGYAPSSRYQYGGIDPLYIQLRAIVFLRLGVSELGGLYVDLSNGFASNGTQRFLIQKQDLNLASYLPTDDGKAAFVLVTIDNLGDVILTKGAEVDILDLDLIDLPLAPSGTIFECGGVRVYKGQTAIQEGLEDTDFVDTRFTCLAGATGTEISSDEANIAAINFLEQVSDPPAPGENHRVIYAKSGGMYEKDSAGTVSGPYGAGTTGEYQQLIWDVVGDDLDFLTENGEAIYELTSLE